MAVAGILTTPNEVRKVGQHNRPIIGGGFAVVKRRIHCATSLTTATSLTRT